MKRRSSDQVSNLQRWPVSYCKVTPSTCNKGRNIPVEFCDINIIPDRMPDGTG